MPSTFRWSSVVRARLFVASAIASSCVGACAPLAQAPLVYSSKVSGGLDLSATSTETPGISLNIGYKAVDAAYVPVAVSQQCVFKDSGDKSCDPSKLKLEIISSQARSSNTEAPGEERSRAAATRLSNAEAILVQKQNTYDMRIAEREPDLKRAAELAAAQAELDTGLAAAPIDDAALETARGRLRLAQEANDRLPAHNAAIKKAADEKAAAEGEVAAAITAKTTLESELERSTHNQRGDAFSVFGSFDSDNQIRNKTADTDARLGVGKVFSTGLASQNLTESMRSVYMTNCYTAASKAAEIITATTIPNEQKSKKISDLFDYCGASSAKGR